MGTKKCVSPEWNVLLLLLLLLLLLRSVALLERVFQIFWLYRCQLAIQPIIIILFVSSLQHQACRCVPTASRANNVHGVLS